MCQFIETLKITHGKVNHIKFHQDRINRTFSRFFPNSPILDLQEAIRFPLPQKGIWRMRMLYNSQILRFDLQPFHQRNFHTLKLIETNMDYSFKFAKRDQLNALKKQKGKADEILIVRNGMISDTSISNICFFDGSKWWTPQDCLLIGTARTRLIQEKQIQIRKITPSDLKNFRKARLINALMDFSDEIDIILPEGILF